MSGKRDYYEVLGVEREATEKIIVTAYRKLALKHHPDRNPDDPEAESRFKEAAEAYDVLSNAQKRALYDQYGHAGLQGSGGGAQFHDMDDIFSAFGDIFGDLFGGAGGRGRGGPRVQRGADVRCDVTIDLLEAAKSVNKTVTINRNKKCGTCSGSGAKEGTIAEACQYCGGSGQVVQSSGFFRVQTTCPGCRGQGSVIKEKCKDCRGKGQVPHKTTMEVRIPAGVDDGTQLVLRGEGDPSPNGGPPGDAYCFIKVKDHPLFQRQGQHLICELPLTYTQAALGAKIEVPTLDGPEELEIPPGTQPNELFRLKNRGMPDPRHSGIGDLVVQVHIEIPKKLTERQEELLRELAEEEQANVSSRRKSFFEQLKDFFVPEEHASDSKE